MIVIVAVARHVELLMLVADPVESAPVEVAGGRVVVVVDGGRVVVVDGGRVVVVDGGRVVVVDGGRVVLVLGGIVVVGTIDVAGGRVVLVLVLGPATVDGVVGLPTCTSTSSGVSRPSETTARTVRVPPRDGVSSAPAAST